MALIVGTLLGSLAAVTLLTAQQLWRTGPLQRHQRAAIYGRWLLNAALVASLLLAATAVQRIFAVKVFLPDETPDRSRWPLLLGPLPAWLALLLVNGAAAMIVRWRRVAPLLVVVAVTAALAAPLAIPWWLIHEDLSFSSLRPPGCAAQSQAWFVPLQWRERAGNETVLVQCVTEAPARWRDARRGNVYDEGALSTLCAKDTCDFLRILPHQWLPSEAQWTQQRNGQITHGASYQGDVRPRNGAFVVDNLRQITGLQ